jgi:hypothetical protein
MEEEGVDHVPQQVDLFRFQRNELVAARSAQGATLRGLRTLVKITAHRAFPPFPHRSSRHVYAFTSMLKTRFIVESR